MKESKKYYIIAAITTFIIVAAAISIISVQLHTMRDENNRLIWNLLAEMKQNNPEMKELDLARILNEKKESGEVKEDFRKYGVTDEQWIALNNNDGSRQLVVTCGIFLGVEFLALCAICFLYSRKKKKEMDLITKYITKLNSGVYSLDLDENKEDDTSLLKNEIYKTTVMLREQREHSLEDKIKLKDSISDISHQLRTPLSSIIITIQNILDDDNMPTEIRRDFLKDVLRSSEHISFLVQSLLVLSKMDAGTMTLKKEKTKVASMCREVIQNTAILAELRAVSVDYQCDESIEIRCDYKWTVEALTNIVKNCVEHTQEGGGVTIVCESNKLYAKITIRDNGEGIAPDDLPHIFQRFYKGKNSSKESIGIGLALAKTIIEKNDGFIRVDSELGKGTTFVIKYFYTVKKG